MEPQQKKRRKNVDVVWDKYWAVLEKKGRARHIVATAAPVHAALLHTAWEQVEGMAQQLSEFGSHRKFVRQRFQSFTLAEVKSSPIAGAALLMIQYDDAAAVLRCAKSTIEDLMEDVQMQQSYDDVPGSEEEVLEQYGQMANYAKCFDVLNRFAVLHSGIRGDLVSGVCQHITKMAALLDREVELGHSLEFDAWHLEALLFAKIKKLDATIDDCVGAAQELAHMLGVAADTHAAAALPVQRCYVCLDEFMFGLTFCSECSSGTVCDGCCQELVIKACESRAVSATTNGEAFRKLILLNAYP